MSLSPNRSNLANGLLASAVNSTTTTWPLQSGYGSTMPAVPFFLTATPFGQLSTMGNSEIANVTAISGDTLTVVRGQKNTTPKSFAAGDVVSNGVYVEDLIGAQNIDFATFSLPKSGVIPGSTFGTTGNKSFTGLGSKPHLVRFGILPSASTSFAQTGVGSMSPTSQSVAVTIVTSAGARASSQTACIGFLSGSTTWGMRASYVSMDDDGFTINVTVASSAFDVAYEAY